MSSYQAAKIEIHLKLGAKFDSFRPTWMEEEEQEEEEELIIIYLFFFFVNDYSLFKYDN